MYKAIFTYNGSTSYIQCNEEDSIMEICKKYANKKEIDIRRLYFLTNGNKLNFENKLSEALNINNKERKEISVLVIDNADDLDAKIIKSKDVICPKCGELCLINFDECKVKLNSCKNKDEQLISLDEFDKTQFVNENKILCDICNKRSKGKATEEKFWRCGTCNKNICIICKSAHDKDHILIEYNKKNYVCHKHNEPLKSYCEACQLNLCEKCNTKHDKEHKIISFEEIMKYRKCRKKYKRIKKSD